MASRGALVGRHRAGGPQAMAPFTGKGGKQTLPSAHTGCANLVQGDLKTHHWAMPQASRNFLQGGKLESTEVLESETWIPSSGDLRQYVSAVSSEKWADKLTSYKDQIKYT